MSRSVPLAHLLAAAALCVLAEARAAHAANVTVDCSGATPGAFVSINEALRTLDLTGPHVVTVTGTCVEHVSLSQRDRLRIQAPAGQTATVNAATASRPVFNVSSSHGLVLERLNLSGGSFGVLMTNASEATVLDSILDGHGRGIVVLQQSFLQLQGVVVRGSGGTAVIGDENSVLVARGSTIEGNGGAGLSLSQGSQATLTDVIVRSNNGTGLVVTTGAKARVTGASIFQNNVPGGIIASDDAVARFDATLRPDGTMVGTLVEGHSRSGVAALFGSTVILNGPHIIRNNGTAGDPSRSGVTATHNSHLRLGGISLDRPVRITNNTGPGVFVDGSSTARLNAADVSNNGEDGIRLRHLSAVELIGGNIFLGNGAMAASCDSTSMTYGDDVNALRPSDCRRR